MPNYNEILGTLEAELERMIHARDKFQEHIEGLYAAIKAIQVLAQDSEEPIVEPPPLSPDEERGFTDRVRSLLKANPARAFAAVDVRSVMLEWDPKADPKIMLIHTHNTLKRLFKQDEVVEVQMPDGRTGYKWKSEVVELMAALKKSLAQMDHNKAAEVAALSEAIRKEKERRR